MRSSADIDLSVTAMAARTEEHIGINLLADDPTSRWCAAIEVAHRLWRDGPIECVHAGIGKAGGITDADMMRANVITTRHVAAAFNDQGCDWRRLAIELTDPDRPIGELVLAEFVGASNVDAMRSHALVAADQLDALSQKGWEWPRTFLACSGWKREWFGVPWWPAHVDVFVADVTDPQSRVSNFYTARGTALAEPPLALADIALGLVTAPERLSVEVLGWCVDAAQLGYVDRQRARSQWEAAGRPRWSPAPLLDGP